MARAHFSRPITDNTGVPVRHATVSVYFAGSNQLIGQPIYADSTTSTTLPNPFPVTNGVVDFYLATAQTVNIGLQSGTTQYTVANLDVLPPVESMVTSPSGLAIANTPVSGQFLQATSATGATWVNASDLLSTKATSLQTLAAYDPSSGATTLRVTDVLGNPVAPTFVAAPTGLPGGQTFTKALQVPATGVVTMSTGAITWPEAGYVQICYKIVASNPATAAILRVSADTGSPSVTTPTATDLVNTWIIAYLGDISAGTHSVHIEHLPGADPASYVLLGTVSVYYGNNIPAHSHAGAGANSTQLGPAASAPYAGDTAIGGTATALNVNATAIGAQTTAEIEGTAVGAYAYAGSYGTAVGYNATTKTGTQGGVALGNAAQTQADNALAVGAGAVSSGKVAVAVGNNATASAPQAIALGAGAAAQAPSSAAIGPGAVVGAAHTGSYAIGPSAATTAANQLMLGTAATTTTFPGTLAVRGNATIGGANATLGFYGASGTPRPTITGSRGGNATVAQVLASLAQLGLVVDNSTP